MSNGNYKHGGKPSQAAKSQEATPAATSTPAPAEMQPAVTEQPQDQTPALRAEIVSLQSEIDRLTQAATQAAVCTGELLGLRNEVAGLKSLIVQKDAANETRKKMLRWLVKNMPLHHVPHFLYGMTDECEPREIHQVIDYMKLQLDERDSSFVESYRIQMADTADARLRAPAVKEAALAAMQDQV